MAEQASSNPYIFGDPEQDRLRLETQTKLISNYVKKHAHEFCGTAVRSILDLGCGEGQLGFALLDMYPDATLVGIDRDQRAIEGARQRAAAGGYQAEFILGDVQDELPAGPFDLVFSSFLLMHTIHPERVLSQAYSRLNSGGGLWVIDMASDPASTTEEPTFKQLLAMLVVALERMGVHPHIMDELPGLLKDSGFEGASRREAQDDHPFLPNNSTEATYVTALSIGGIYSARVGLAKANGVPLEQIEQMLVRLMNKGTGAVVFSDSPCGVVTARKP